MNFDIEGILNSESNKIKNFKDFWLYFNKCCCDAGIKIIDDIFLTPSCDGGIYNLYDINGIPWYHSPIGNHICQLRETNKLLKNDYFLLSKQHVIEDNDNVINSLSSEKASYEQLSTQLMKDILDGLYCKSMVYENKYDYAISSHNHDSIYSRVNIELNPKYQNTSEMSTVGTIQLTTDVLTGEGAGKYDNIHYNPSYNDPIIKSYDFNVKKVIIPLPPKPMIGTLKFIGIQTMQKLIEVNNIQTDSDNVNPYDSSGKIRVDYDGWVFPNGSLIENKSDQLSDAAEFYSNGSNIEVPCIYTFLKCFDDSSDSYSHHEQSIVLPNHTHVIQPMKFTGDLSFNEDESELSGTIHYGGKYFVHIGSKIEKVFEVKDVKLKFDDTVIDSTYTTKTKSDNQTYYPKHNIIPIMIYIGGELPEYYANIE